MNILIQPNSLSLVGSMNHIVISTENEVSFVLADGSGNAIVKHLYVPSETNRIEVDLKNIILPLLSFNLQDVSSPYQQTNIVKSFTATVTENVDNGETKTISFTVIRAGVDHFDGDASSFLQQNFLTWQPNVKPVTYYTPEFLTYYAVVAATVKCTAYFEDGTTQSVSLASIAAGECWTVPVQYAVIAGKCSNKLPQYYEVWVENASGQRLTYIQRYVASDMKSEEEEWILFENSLGGIDTFRAYGDSENTAKHTHNVAEIEEDFEEYRVDTTREHKKNTGYLGMNERVWLLDFFPSTGKYIYTDNYIRRIVVTESGVSYNAKELPSTYNFTYKYADARPYLNLSRAELPQKVLNIKVPDLVSFTVAPRLAEFPRLTLSGGALFPVQSPYSDQWMATTATAILDYFIRQIKAGYSGDGGIGHIHSNIELLNGLQFLENYLLVYGKKIKAGYADEAKRLSEDSPVWRQFIRKDKDDTTPYNLGVGRSLTIGNDLKVGGDGNVDGSLTVGIDTKTKNLDVTNQATTEKLTVNDTSVFGGAMSSPLFRSGFLDGYGWSLFKQVVQNALGVGEDKYTLEIDNLIVRQSMRIYEMIISQLLGEDDNRVFTAMMEVDHYDASTGKVYFNNNDGKLYNPFRKYDYIMVQQYNPSATDGWVIKHYELIIIEVGSDTDSDGNRQDWVKFYNFTSASGETAAELIAQGDTFVRVDNAVDPERKGIVTITTVGANTPYIDIIHGLKTDSRHAMKGRIGNLSGLQTEQFGWLQGFGEYLSNLYAVGHFKLASTGESVSARIEANTERLSSTYSETTYNIKEEDNYIPNGMFAQGLDKWGVVGSDGLTAISNDLTDEEKAANIVTITDGTNTVPLFLNGGTVGQKHTQHAVAETFDGTKVIHLYGCGISQPWSQLKANGTHEILEKSADSDEYSSKTVANTLYFAIRFLAVTSGTLSMEFHDDDSTSNVSNVVSWNITSSDLWQTKESDNKTSNWSYDPTKNGRLIITYTGEMLLRFVTLTDKPLDDYKQTVSTQFLQTADSIKLLGEKYDALDGTVTNLGIELRAADEEIRLYVDKQTSDAETRLGVRIDGVEEKISLYASKLESDYYTKSQIDVNIDAINLSVSSLSSQLSSDISDLQSQIDATNSSVGSLRTYIDGTFADGIIEQSERIAIEKYLKTLEGTKKDLDSAYTELMDNSLLSADSDEYKNLKTAKDTLDASYTSLVSAIKSAIEDDKATDDEKTSVNAAFDTFNNAIAEFSKGVKDAEDYIRRKGITDNNQYYYTKSEIDVKVGEINSSVVGINSQISGLSDNIDNLQSQIDATNTTVGNLQTSLSSLDTYIDGAFANGIIEQSEKIAIEKYLKTLEGTKKDLDSAYTELIKNNYLDAASDEYENLADAKTTLDSSYNSLVSTINSAIADDKATNEERTSVDTAFDTFNNAISNFSTCVKKAEDYIRIKIADGAEERAKEWARQLSIDAAGAEVYTQATNPWTKWENGKQSSHVGAVWHYTRATDSGSDPTINLIDGTSGYVESGSTYRYIGYDGTNKWECIDNIAASASYILQNKDAISAVVANFDADGNVLDSSGIVTTATGNTLYATKQATTTNLFMGTANGDGWEWEHSTDFDEMSFSEADRRFSLKNFYPIDQDSYSEGSGYSTLIFPVIRVEKDKMYIVSVGVLKDSNINFSLRIDDGSSKNSLSVRTYMGQATMSRMTAYDEGSYYRYYYVLKAENSYIQIRFINAINSSTVTTRTSSNTENITASWPYGTDTSDHTISDKTTVDYGSNSKQSIIKTRTVIKHRYNGDTSYNKVTETTQTTAPIGTLYLQKLQFEKAANNSDTDKPSEYKEEQNSIESYIKQTAEGVKIKASQISLEGYTSINGGFIVDTDGNAKMKNAEVEGTIKSSNFYHCVCVYGFKNMMYYVKEASDRTAGETQTIEDGEADGHAYPYTERTYISEDDFDEYYGDTALTACSGSADIIIVPNTSKNSSETRYITLPRASDFQGKIIEIYDSEYSNVGTVGKIIVSCIKSETTTFQFGSGVYASTQSSGEVRIDFGAGADTYTLDGGSVTRFYSIQDTDGNWRWLRMQ